MARRTIFRALACLPALMLAATVAGCAEEVDPGGESQAGDEVELINPNQLTTCTHLPYPPFQFTENGKTVGFDVEIVDLVAQELGVEQSIFDTSFESIESGQAFDTGQCDLAAAAMTITGDRDRVMDFSDGYFDADQALLVRKGSGVTGLDQLRGRTLGVQLGTTGEKYAEENKDRHGYQTRQFEDLALLQTAVQTGQVAAGINDNSVLLHFVQTNQDTDVTAEFDTGEQYGIAMQTDNGALRSTINDVLERARQDGTYDRIYEKWFGKSPDE